MAANPFTSLMSRPFPEPDDQDQVDSNILASATASGQAGGSANIAAMDVRDTGQQASAQALGQVDPAGTFNLSDVSGFDGGAPAVAGGQAGGDFFNLSDVAELDGGQASAETEAANHRHG